MQQYFAKDKDLNLEDSDYYHIKKVMRMKPGDLIKVVFDNTTYLCKINDLECDKVFTIIDYNINEDNGCKIDVAFSLIKEQKLNYLIQKSVEVGVNDFICLNTSRSIVKIDKKKEESKIIRWQRICKEAAEQSYRSKVPEIKGILNIKDLINYEYDLKLLCSLNKNTKNIKKVLQKNYKCAKILLVTGPEGGFSKEEEQYLMDNGFISVSLGENVLRAETAPIVAISIINYELMR